MTKYNPQKIEKKWQRIWQKTKIYEPDFKSAKKPFYNLMMFPYPSAEGLHTGNMYAFTGSDIYGRFKRMQGDDVFEPIGLDGFGIHSENYALKIGAHPAKQAKISEKRFYKQLSTIGNCFAWEERLETYDSEYYRWTQWIFLQLFKNGLAYRKKQAVNWCLSCKTVLADEQVINDKCERCNSQVEKKELEQWFFKITKYAEKLLKNLEKLDWSEKVKIAQKNWIGKSEGTEIKFVISNSQFVIPVFTTRVDTLFGCTYVVLAPEQPIISNLKFQISNLKEVERYIKEATKKTSVERLAEDKEKTGVELKGVKAINPTNQEEIPVFVADYVLGNVGTGAIMAVPAHDQRDFEFAKYHHLPIRQVVVPIDTDKYTDLRGLENAFEEDGILINSEQFSGLKSDEARVKITQWLQKEKKGKKTICYKLRDWLISRQRYWGPPIPVIFCENCKKLLENSIRQLADNPSAGGQNSKFLNKFNKGELENPGWIAVPEKDLPVKLPFVKDFQPKGKGVSPLASVKSFYEVKCPKCGNKAKRETDVSDTFLDSSWYYLRYPSIADNKNPWNSSLTKKWLPVNMYIGGAEHSVLHLLYSRFLAMVFCDLKLTHFDEPFKKFRAHGLLIKEGVKMSKSKGNVVEPDDYIKKFGTDVFRMYLMFLAPFEQGGDFRDDGIIGIKRLLDKVFVLSQKLINNPQLTANNKQLEKLLHQTVKKVTEDIENLRYNTAISALMILVNEMAEQSTINNQQLTILLLLLAPFAPHLTEELWHQLGGKSSIHIQLWPKYNPKLIKEEIITLIIQVNGRVRDKIEVEADISKEQAEKLAIAREKIKKYIANQKIKKIIFVPEKLINIVV